MGQLITTLVGGVIGFMLGGPLGASIGMTLGGMIGATLFGPTIKGPRLNDLKVTASTYGMAIPEIYGTVRLSGNLIWSAGIKETKHKSGGGKGMPKPKQVTYTYSASFASAICKGVITDVTRIWADSKLIYDKTQNTTRAPVGSAASSVISSVFLAFGGKPNKKKKYKFRIYKGTEDQVPDSLIEADKGVGNVSGHRGLAYIVAEEMPLVDFGNRIPQLTFEVTKSKVETFPSVVVKGSEGIGSLVGATGRAWYPDWENGRLFSYYRYSGGMDLLDLETMSLVAHSANASMGFPHRYAFAPHVDRIYYGTGLSNSGSVTVASLSAMSVIDVWGENSLSLSGYYYIGGPRAGRFALANAFDNDIGVTQDGSLVVMIGWTRDSWIVSGDTGKPVGWFKAPHESSFMLTCQSADRKIDTVIGWRNASGVLQLTDYIGGNVGSYGVKTSSGNTYWTQAAFSGTIWNLSPFAGETFAARTVLWDPTDGCMFALGYTYLNGVGTPCAFKYNLATGVYKFRRKHPGMILHDGNMPWSRIAGGSFGWIVSAYRTENQVNMIDLQTGDWTKRSNWSGAGWGDNIYGGDGQHWDDESQSIIVETQGTYRRIWFIDGIRNLKVSDVVKDICVNSGELTLSDIDTTGMVDQDVTGIAIDRQSSARDALKILATAYLFDAYESDYKLKFRTRGNASQVTIPESWIARGDEVVKETLTQELEMPMRISVNYYDITRDHQQGTQSAKRKAGPIPTMWSSKEDVVDLPLVMTPDMAKQSADKLLRMAWANRTGLQFTLPWRYLKYDPTDVVTVSMDSGTSYLLRLSDFNIGERFTIEASAVSEKPAAYVSTAKGNAGTAPTQDIGSVFPVTPIVINTPLLRDEDYDPSKVSICYMSATTKALTFDGALLYLDKSGGGDFDSIGYVASDTVAGATMSVLPYVTYYEATDETSVLQVRLNNPLDELESITQEDMLNNPDRNAALVGDEIIQFRTATQQADGTWKLTGLRRARRGTNYALKTHVVGETFVMLSTEAVALWQRDPSNYNTVATFRAVSKGGELADATSVVQRLYPRDLQPYTPEDVKITDDGTDVTITMSRRSRITAPLRDKTGGIHYREGDKTASKISYYVWAGYTINSADLDVEDVSDSVSVEGTIPVFDENGFDLPLEITFPLASLTHPSLVGQQNKFLIRLTEQGVVEGTPKWIEFERLGQGRWNKTDFY